MSVDRLVCRQLMESTRRVSSVTHRSQRPKDIPAILRRARPGGRLSTLHGHEHTGQPVVLTEFGGIAYAPQDANDESWGYSVVRTPDALENAYSQLLQTVRELPLLAGFCYTQFADTYQETNGLLYADRTPKFPIERIAEATEGPERRRLASLKRRRKRFKTSVAETTVTLSADVKKVS